MKSFLEYMDISNEALSVKERVLLLNEDAEKPIQHSIVHDEVRKALKDLVSLMPQGEWVIIGGIALGAYGRSRATTDIDIAITGSMNLDSIAPLLASKFKRHRNSAFEHNATGVEVEFVNSDLINIPSNLIQSVINSARKDLVDGKEVLVANPKHLIALKLKRATKKDKSLLVRASQDKTDIMQLTQAFGKQDLSDVQGLSQEEKDLYADICKELEVN